MKLKVRFRNMKWEYFSWLGEVERAAEIPFNCCLYSTIVSTAPLVEPEWILGPSIVLQNCFVIRNFTRFVLQCKTFNFEKFNFAFSAFKHLWIRDKNNFRLISYYFNSISLRFFEIFKLIKIIKNIYHIG